MNAKRKLLTIVCEGRLEEKVTAAILEAGAHGYTVTDARGGGSRGVRDAAWGPSANVRIEVVCEARVADAIAERLRRDYYDVYAMILFAQDVEVLRPEKF